MESPFILASQSPRRKELLEQILNTFKVVVPRVEELDNHAGGPTVLVCENARIKADALAKEFPNFWILGADTIVALEDEPLGKPKTLNHALEMLLRLSGKTHFVHTGICLVRHDQRLEKFTTVTSKVTFKNLTPEIIAQYFKEVNPLDKAGGYAIQTRSDLIIESLEGSRTNVIGLPLELVREWLDEYLPNSIVG
jgi:septum formation protein